MVWCLRAKVGLEMAWKVGQTRCTSSGNQSPMYGGVGQFLPWPPEMCFETSKMRVHATSPLGATNQYLVECAETKEAVVVDFVDASPLRWAAFAARCGVRVRSIVLTHLRQDRVGHLLSGQFALGGVPITAHAMALKEREPDDVWVKDGDYVGVGKLQFRVLDTPGAGYPGHIALYEPHQGVAFVGDLLTRGGVSRPTHLAPHQLEARQKDLHRLVRTLPESCLLFPAKYGVTYMAAERRSNPDLIGLSGPALTPLLNERAGSSSPPRSLAGAASSSSASADTGDGGSTSSPSTRTRSSWHSS